MKYGCNQCGWEPIEGKAEYLSIHGDKVECMSCGAKWKEFGSLDEEDEEDEDYWLIEEQNEFLLKYSIRVTVWNIF